MIEPSPPPASAQVARMLALVPYVLARKEMTIEELARDLNMSAKQVVKDLKVLMFCGWPGWYPGDYIEVDLDALEGQGVVRVSNADYLDRPLRLTVSEASSLIVALRALRDASAVEVQPLIDRTLRKLEAAAEDGAAAASRVEVHLRPDDTAPLRQTLRAALDAGNQIELEYFVPVRDEVTVRVVDPFALINSQGVHYLAGWCHRAEARRTFRLDRVEGVQVLATRRVHEPVGETFGTGEIFAPGPDTQVATIRLSPRARWVAEYYPVVSTEELPEGELRVVLAVSDSRWLQRLVLRLAPEAAIEEPSTEAAAAVRQAAAALALYVGSDVE